MKIIDSGSASADYLMKKDYQLLQELGNEPIFHFYKWSSLCATFGYFIEPEEHFNFHEMEKIGFEIARRPTGGGIIFHVTDFAFSILIPQNHFGYSVNTLENYAFVNRFVAGVVEKFLGRTEVIEFLQKCPSGICVENHCMAKPTQYDLMIDGKKVGGAAQRRTKRGYLHQGTFFLAMPPEGLLDSVLKNGEAVFEAIREQSLPLLQDQENLENARSQIKGLFTTEAPRLGTNTNKSA